MFETRELCSARPSRIYISWYEKKSLRLNSPRLLYLAAVRKENWAGNAVFSLCEPLMEFNGKERKVKFDVWDALGLGSECFARVTVSFMYAKPLLQVLISLSFCFETYYADPRSLSLSRGERI